MNTATCPATGVPVPIPECAIRRFRPLCDLDETESAALRAVWNQPVQMKRGSNTQVEMRRIKREAQELAIDILEIRP